MEKNIYLYIRPTQESNIVELEIRIYFCWLHGQMMTQTSQLDNFISLHTFGAIIIVPVYMLKLIYCKKATRFEKISYLFLRLLSSIKTSGRIFFQMWPFQKPLTLPELKELNNSGQVRLYLSCLILFTYYNNIGVNKGCDSTMF